MQAYFGLTGIILLIVLVIIRVLSLKKQGIEAMEFGRKDKKDFFILPFALFYFYLLIARAFNLPDIPGQELFHSEAVSWIGVAICLLSLLLFLWTLVSFKQSFRVGLVDNTAQGLITTGAFALSRNPIYVAFALMLLGQFLIYPSWIRLMYMGIAFLTFHRQVLKEEQFLSTQYPDAFPAYCNKVRRYM